MKALAYEAPTGIFNVCTGKETPLLDVLRLLLNARRPGLEPEFREARAVNHVARRFGDPVRASEKLKFNAKISLETGVPKLVVWRDQVLESKKGLSNEKVNA